VAKDDYDVILFKILLYLYACFQGKIVFQNDVFEKTVKNGISDEYINRILRGAQSENLIEGLVFTHTWGNEYILSSPLSDMAITPDGIRYLKDNGKMQKAKSFLLEHSVELISTLIPKIF
jgi:hypothetical protein